MSAACSLVSGRTGERCRLNVDEWLATPQPERSVRESSALPGSADTRIVAASRCELTHVDLIGQHVESVTGRLRDQDAFQTDICQRLSDLGDVNL